jgi:hypothetical protein
LEASSEDVRSEVAGSVVVLQAPRLDGLAVVDDGLVGRGGRLQYPSPISLNPFANFSIRLGGGCLQAVQEEAHEERSGKDRSDCFVKVSKLITRFQFWIFMNQNLRFNRGRLLVRRVRSMFEASENQLRNPRKKCSFMSQLEES